MNDRYAASMTLVHNSDGSMSVSVFLNPIDGCAEEIRRIEYHSSAPEESTDAHDWLRQALAAAAESC